MLRAAPRPRAPGSWPHALAVAAALAAVPLVLFGGSVTTLGAGMAVDGWLVAEGHFLVFFPLEEWFRDTATFVEHTHRLFGVLVGLLALASAATALFREDRRSARLLALSAFAGVCLQGVLGGLRVLENDPRLAFLHGALAQAVFALLCANALFLSRDWRSARVLDASGARGRPARMLGALALAGVFAQVVLGAWYRHGLRSPVPSAGPAAGTRFVLHALGALAVIALLVLFLRCAARMRSSAEGSPAGFVRASRRLPVLLVVQLVLGGLSWASYRPGAIGPAEWGLSIAHVLGGALLLAECTLLWMWVGRLSARPEVRPARRASATLWSEA